MPSTSHSPLSVKQSKRSLKRWFAGLTSCALTLTLWASPGFAKDPFRTSNPKAIGDRTEAAFRAIFEQGNYAAARQYLQTAEPSEPLAHAMSASMSYMDQDWAGVKANAAKTREAAERLTNTDPLRGNLYTAVGHFLEGAYIIGEQGAVKGAPQALNKLQVVFQYLDKAEKLAPQDPEVNILKGFMDLMLSVNLPFANPLQAIERLEKYAGPDYLADRGIAIGYRDLKQYDKAMNFVDQSLKATPDNPDVLYLKAQILVGQNRHQESLDFFRRALAKRNQLPPKLAGQIDHEFCRAERKVTKVDQDCKARLK